MRSTYWSCTKFATWLRGTAKPYSATEEGWNNWQKIAEKKKFRYWLAEEGLDHLQDVIFWPIDRIRAVRNYISHRWAVKTHALTSTLKRGEYHELDTRLLYAVFDELIIFVENELASMRVVFSSEERKKYRVPWYRSYLGLKSWRNAQAGIAYLNWAAALKRDEEWVDKNDPTYGEPTSQALAAQEILQLYQWWKHTRPNRPDPDEISGWSKYCEQKSTINKIDEDVSRDILNACFKIEKEYEEEDTQMLIRLIKIRSYLWT
jgi:hypothetical protein